MATYMIFISYAVEATETLDPDALAKQIGDLAVAEHLVNDFAVIDIEEVDSDAEELDFDEDDEAEE